jgi:ABC-type uncharacterized transport system substrate-binding protein
MSLKPLLVCLLCAASLVCAHPHVFVDAKIKVMFDNAGFSAVKNHWVYDEIYSSAMMSSGDADGDGKISESENKWFLETILGPLKEFNYYNYVQSGSIFLKAQGLSNFKASFKNNRLMLDFETKFSSPIGPDYTMLVIAVADPSNYIQVTADMENADVDGPESFDIEFFNDGLQGLTLFRAFRSDIEGLYLRFKKK